MNKKTPRGVEKGPRVNEGLSGQVTLRRNWKGQKRRQTQEEVALEEIAGQSLGRNCRSVSSKGERMEEAEEGQ